MSPYRFSPANSGCCRRPLASERNPNRAKERSMLNALEISTSALVAQRTRINAIAGNVANISSTHNEAGAAQAYQPRFVVFQTDDSVQAPGGARGVKVESVQVANVEPNY